MKLLVFRRYINFLFKKWFFNTDRNSIIKCYSSFIYDMNVFPKKIIFFLIKNEDSFIYSPSYFRMGAEWIEPWTVKANKTIHLSNPTTQFFKISEYSRKSENTFSLVTIQFSNLYILFWFFFLLHWEKCCKKICYKHNKNYYIV